MNDAERLLPEPLIVDTAQRVFAQAGSDYQPATGLAAKDWTQAHEAGLCSAWVPESLGGAGAAPVDGLAVARIAGRHAVALPVADTLLAGWMLAACGIAPPDGPLAVAIVEPGTGAVTDAPVDLPSGGTAGPVRACVDRVGWARHATHLVLCTGAGEAARVFLLDAASVRVEPGASLAGEPLDRVVIGGAVPLAVGTCGGGADAAAARRLGALLRAHQMAGALERVLEIALGYAGERVQFGRPISRFQAVQHELARLAGECAAAGAAASAGATALARHGLAAEHTARAAAMAKIRVGEAAGAGAAIAHQVHGAMGFSQEYVLQRFTRRLWSWRDDFGGETEWAQWLGARIAADGADALWPALTRA